MTQDKPKLTNGETMATVTVTFNVNLYDEQNEQRTYGQLEEDIENALYIENSDGLTFENPIVREIKIY